MNIEKQAIQSYTDSITNILPGLTQEELNFIVSKVTVTKLDNGKFYLNTGEIQPSMGFVYKGLLRSYYIDKNGKEITISFIKENAYASDYSEFLTKKPSKFYIQALESCVFVNLPYLSMQECYSKYKNFEKYGRLVAENILIMRHNRIESFLFENAEQRYLNFIEQDTVLLNRISLTHLSSFLGIERQSLTRIRKKLTKK
ncbi:MAG: cAMP-binding protein [Flavobacterium sp.]|nr:MAG: cAMP-binding protein [Flavobacterium sp.]